MLVLLGDVNQSPLPVPPLLDSTSGSLVAVWAAWNGGLDNSTMQVVVVDGGNATPINNVPENTIDIYKKAQVTITFPDFGIDGPNILQGNEVFIPIEKPSILYGLWTTPREWILKDDLIAEKQTRNTNAALNWAKIDSIAPLQNDGTRDARYLTLLYDMTAGSLNPNIKSVTLPNGDAVELDHSYYDTLMSVAQEAALKAGYADVESLTVIVTKPQNLSDFRLLSNRSVPVIPTDIAIQMTDSSCPQLKLETDALNSLANAGLSQNSLNDILSRLLETVWAK